MLSVRKNKIIKKIIILLFIILSLNKIFGENINDNESNLDSVSSNLINEVGENVKLDKYIESLQDYIKENNTSNIDMKKLADELIKGGSINYKNFVFKILSLISSGITKSLSSAITIFIIIVIIAIISSLELEEKSEITKLTHLVCLISILVIMISNLNEIIVEFKKSITTLTTLMQVISPFLMGVIIVTGRISQTGIIKPMLLFLASAIGFLINYVVIPFLCISVTLNIISSLSENLNFSKMAKLFNSTSIWIISVTLTIFLGILSLEKTFASSIDSLTIKATQTAVSSFVPVVGKFFSDSFETVVGATQVIANVGGIIGIIAIIIVAIFPIIKILSVMVIYMILASIAEPICKNEQIIKLISSFASTYKTILGILIGITILYIISTGIIINLVSTVKV